MPWTLSYHQLVVHIIELPSWKSRFYLVGAYYPMCSMVLEYLPTWLGHIYCVNVGVHIPAPWSIWVYCNFFSRSIHWHVSWKDVFLWTGTCRVTDSNMGLGQNLGTPSQKWNRPYPLVNIQKNYGKLWFTVDLPIKNGDFPYITMERSTIL